MVLVRSVPIVGELGQLAFKDFLPGTNSDKIRWVIEDIRIRNLFRRSVTGCFLKEPSLIFDCCTRASLNGIPMKTHLGSNVYVTRK